MDFLGKTFEENKEKWGGDSPMSETEISGSIRRPRGLAKKDGPVARGGACRYRSRGLPGTWNRRRFQAVIIAVPGPLSL
jgi:hypothetical protein